VVVGGRPFGRRLMMAALARGEEPLFPLPLAYRQAMATITHDAPHVCGVANIGAAGAYVLTLICTACEPVYNSGPVSVCAESAEMARERLMRRHASEVHGWAAPMIFS